MRALLLLTLAACAAPAAGEAESDLRTPTSDAALLDEVQRTTFRYFWEFGHPDSGMARERSTSGHVTTTGGTGFGVQAMLVAASRGFITREDASARVTKIVDFLGRADRFHGAWSHWVDGRTGRVVPFSRKDDGGDLVETSLLLAGLLSARTYFDAPAEAPLRAAIDALWRDVDFAWYAHDGALFWHWSPNWGWQMNLPIRGWNEALITYVLALGSPTHPVPTAIYEQGFIRPGFQNNARYEGYQLPLGPAYGGPLFLAQYSFLGLDPRRMADRRASYWYQNTVHTRINRAYCVDRPERGYGPALWGLTASDNPDGYAAHSPTHDNGTIAPTAALASMPYTPYESLLVARNLRAMPGAFGELGFVDALNPKRGWFDPQTIAIDQGPIIVMIENYRTGLPWRLLMSAPEIASGLARASIREPDHATGFYLAVADADDRRVQLVRHPDRGAYLLDVAIHDAGTYSLSVDGHVVWNAQPQPKGVQAVDLGALAPGAYTVRLSGPNVERTLAVRLH